MMLRTEPKERAFRVIAFLSDWRLLLSLFFPPQAENEATTIYRSLTFSLSEPSTAAQKAKHSQSLITLSEEFFRIARTMQQLGDAGEALPLAEKAIALRREAGGEAVAEMVESLGLLGQIYKDTARYEVRVHVLAMCVHLV